MVPSQSFTLDLLRMVLRCFKVQGRLRFEGAVAATGIRKHKTQVNVVVLIALGGGSASMQ